MQAKNRVFEVVNHVLNGTLDLDNLFSPISLVLQKPGIWHGTLNTILQKSDISKKLNRPKVLCLSGLSYVFVVISFKSRFKSLGKAICIFKGAYGNQGYERQIPPFDATPFGNRDSCHRLCLSDLSPRFSGDPENNEKTRQNAENKQTFDLSGKIDIEGKTRQNTENKQTFGIFY